MAEVELNGLVYVFEDDMKLIDWLDANADELREDKGSSSYPDPANVYSALRSTKAK